MVLTENEVTFSRELWEELKNDDYFHELIDIIEDRDALREAKKETEYFMDYEEYRKSRLAKLNV